MSNILYETIERTAFFYEDTNITFPSHLHRQLELFYLLEGIVEIRLGNRQFTMQEKDSAIILPNVIHSYESISDSRFYIGFIDPQKLGSNGNRFRYCECLNPINPISCYHPEALHVMNVLAMQNKKNAPIEHEERIIGYFNVLVDYFLDHLKLAPSDSHDRDDLLKTILNYILGHYMEALSLDSVAKEVGVNKYYLSRLFSEKIGCTFPDYLAMIRVDCARELLKTTDKSVDEIAYLCGFQSDSSFFRNFKKIAGVTPKQYKGL